MRAIDTNVVVRLLARDDESQLRIAEAILDEPFLILPTVILESVWVMQTRFGLSAEEVATRLRLLLGQGNAQIQSGEAMLWALSRFANGSDFADALHVALAHEAEVESFSTFDKKLARMPVNDIDITLEQLG